MRLHYSTPSQRPPDVEIKTYSAEQTYLIGKTAAELAGIDMRDGLAADGGIIRIGLIASPRVGKSTFCAGFMGSCLTPGVERKHSGLSLIFEDTFYKEGEEETLLSGLDKPFVGQEEDTPGRIKKQSFSHSGKVGLIRHYDAALSLSKDHALPAYADPEIRERIIGSQRVDLVEHPADDKFDKEFDLIIKLTPRRPVEWLDDKTAPRETNIQFFCTEKIAKNPFFKELIERCTACTRPEVKNTVPAALTL